MKQVWKIEKGCGEATFGFIFFALQIITTLGKEEKLQNYFVLFKARASGEKEDKTLSRPGSHNTCLVPLFYYIDDIEFKNYLLKQQQQQQQQWVADRKSFHGGI